MEAKRKIPKWGFGMSPISGRMQGRYDFAVQSVLDFLERELPPEEIDVDQISELKGMLNRCLRKDQWDWFTVFSRFDAPSRKSILPLILLLADLRRSALSKEIQKIALIKGKLLQLNLLGLLQTFKENSHYPSNITETGWIYILSTRDQPNILKIGMTRRSVTERVKEINSATGVLFPYSAREIFRVNYAAKAEREIFTLLNQYRIRRDREFFDMPFRLAVQIIETYIEGLKESEA